VNTVKVIRFNWPKYAGALAIALAAAVSTVLGGPSPVTAALWMVGVPGAVWAVSSVAATYWSYDRGNVYWRLADGLGDLGEWAAVHAGFDDSVPTLTSSIGRPPVAVATVAGPAGPSLRRARALTGQLARPPDHAGARSLAGLTADSIFVTFAAHEVRGLADQRALFGELRRALRPGGRLVITEHARDLANFAVYGPGAMHFQALATWFARAAEAGLSIESDTSITPFIHRLVCRR
jgi:SAM-dependent methyltransferase